MNAILTRVLVAVSALLLGAALISTSLRTSIMDQPGLEANVRAVTRQPTVRSYLAAELSQAVLTRADDRLFAAAPVVEEASDIVVASPQFADLTALAVEQAAHDIVAAPIRRGQPTHASRLQETPVQLLETLRSLRPDLAARVPVGIQAELVHLDGPSQAGSLLRTAGQMARWWWVLCLAAILTAFLSVLSSTMRRRTVGAGGLASVLTGGALLIARWVGILLAGQRVPAGPARRALSTAVTVFTSGFAHSCQLVIVLGATVMLATTIPGNRLLNTLLVRVKGIRRPRLSPLVAIAVMLAGVGAIVERNVIGPVVIVVAAIGSIVWMLRILLPSPAAAPLVLARMNVRTHRRLLGAVGLSAATLVTVVIVRDSFATASVLQCNDHAELCNRRLDQVVLATTHNSMNNVEDGFLFAEQSGSIGSQLRYGIRAFLIDTHYGIPTTSGRIWTDLVGVDRDHLVKEYGEAAVIAGEAARSELAQPDGPHAIYLCHNYCELGATRFIAGLETVRRFLVTHPADVVVLFIQDQTTPSDTAADIKAAGLQPYAYVHPVGPGIDTAWPTLREMARRGTRLVVLTEHDGGSPAWYQGGFSGLVQDTSFDVRSPSAMTCAPNRGAAASRLFLLNNWVERTPASRADATTVNNRATLTARVAQCRAQRGRLANMIAVNFYANGNLMDTVNELNGVGPIVRAVAPR